MVEKPRSEQPTIIFLHILKTAGTTLNVLLENYFTQENSFATFPNHIHPEGSLEAFQALSTSEKAKIDFLTGHLGFGLHRELPRPAVYITLVRDPTERVISRYYNEKWDPHSHLHRDIKNGMNLSEYVQYYAEAAEMDNLQTRMIAGNWNKRGFGPCTEEMLDTAKKNLETRFAACGLTERFDAFYLLLTRIFNWTPYFYQRYNVRRDGDRKAPISEETRKIIQQHNLFDLELYQFVEGLFKRQMKEQGLRFGMQARIWSERNRLHSRYQSLRSFSLRMYLRERIRG